MLSSANLFLPARLTEKLRDGGCKHDAAEAHLGSAAWSLLGFSRLPKDLWTCHSVITTCTLLATAPGPLKRPCLTLLKLTSLSSGFLMLSAI
ncbi:hypothetical protein BV20DRAFT_876233 [Pilatotrama ljubarskyi]|nr:hypothetical protein BV20DRAFT_876233 [Pilatotrama ljubarskyi]